VTEDLSTLDGNALVARLAVVKERVLDDASAVSADGWDTDRADTEAVLDECAVRLLGPGPKQLTPGEPDAVPLAGTGAEIERLRGLIGAVARGPWSLGSTPPWDMERSRATTGLWHCVSCAADWNGHGRPAHARDCPWPSLLAEEP